MDIRTLATEMDSIVAQGAIVEAVEKYFADNANTSDYNNVTTTGKAQMVEKMRAFADAIAKVNGIEHHGTYVDGNITLSLFTFDFLMKDDSKVLWHEIIKRNWNNEGLVTFEEYFNA
ncbi:hypothetical protein AB9K32_03445 [Allomuricauda sp. XS_ASV26]|jgi:hypothetical protein|uniref:hypothetical protein n=1 Tax=Flavobacteriaceae TaxID=49546 RepID=UPI001CD203D5|nr:hypothetical protein [Allomuricauda ruestringensis]MCA0959800.1 hypothetical protein [Allomuricauda ruestringensis]